MKLKIDLSKMHREVNHKTLRVVVGLIALLLAPTVLLLSNEDRPLTSISISYWTDAGDVFVGALFAVGFFLSAYNGQGGKVDWEFFLSKSMCALALCVALCPTAGFNCKQIPPGWTSSIAGIVGCETKHIHYGAAVLLFAGLIVMMWSFSLRAARKEQHRRSWIYRIIAVAMGLGIVLILVIGTILKYPLTVLLTEWWGLTLFGIGWLVAGSYRERSNVGR